MATGPTREKWERALDQREIVRLRRRGYTQAQIARTLGLSQAQVSKDLNRALSEAQRMILADRVARDAKVHVEELLEQVDEVQQEAWETWDWSKGRLTESLRNQLMEQLVEAKGDIPEYIQLRLSKMPDAVYLKTILNCIGAKAKLLGLESPTTSVSLTSLTQVQSLSWDQLVQRPSITPADRLEDRIQLAGKPPISNGEPDGEAN